MCFAHGCVPHKPDKHRGGSSGKNCTSTADFQLQITHPHAAAGETGPNTSTSSPSLLPGRHRKRKVARAEPTLADSGYLHFSIANKNKLLLKCGTGREMGFTSFEQSVLAKNISGGREGEREGGEKALLVCTLMQCVAAAEAVCRAAPSAGSDRPSHKLGLCRAQRSLHM